MITRLKIVTILVRDQEEALNFYTNSLGFRKVSDQPFGPGMRWLTVAPASFVPGDVEICLLKPEPMMHGEIGAAQLLERVGQNPAWSFLTDDCRGDYEAMRARGVEFASPPQAQMYGIEAVFRDCYGNAFSMVQPPPAFPPQRPASQQQHYS